MALLKCVGLRVWMRAVLVSSVLFAGCGGGDGNRPDNSGGSGGSDEGDGLSGEGGGGSAGTVQAGTGSSEAGSGGGRAGAGAGGGGGAGTGAGAGGRGSGAATDVCGDGMTTGNEFCDDGNTVTEICAYGETSCTVCTDQCLERGGTASYCGDGDVDDSNGEECDDSNAVTESCAYNDSECTVCNADCDEVSGATSLCGDGSEDADNGEECDDGNAATEACTYGETSCTVCDATCQEIAGATSRCGDGLTDASNDEECDDQDSDPLDGCDACQLVAVPGCGNGIVDSGENCDDSNTVVEECPYGTACMVCDNTCHLVAGVVPSCGDGDTDSPQEACDTAGASETCTAQCTLQRYCVLEFSLTGSFQLTGALAGNGTYPQTTPGTIRMRLPDNGSGAPGPGHASILYYNVPTMFAFDSLVDITTNITTTAGTPTNMCPLSTGTLTGTNATWNACTYGANHCTNDWTPDNQQTDGPGCLPVHATGTITCSGFCSAAGLMSGANQVDDTWFQPQNTGVFNAAFTTASLGGVGAPPACGSGDPGNKLEVPERVPGRSWVSGTGTRTSMTCNLLPATGCP